MKRLAVLGSTGSIGTQTLDIVRSFPDDFRIVALAARSRLELLDAQIKEFRPKLVWCEGTDQEKAALNANGSVDCGMEDMALDPEVDLVVMATVGAVGFGPTISAIKAGKNVALANKESVVMGGQILTDLARSYDVDLLPVDSEPSAIWQCLRGESKDVSRLMITASGGAFRNFEPQQLANVTPKQALKHPTWKMGPKITIDSATLMNKAFEVIEAHWLFGIAWENIDVVIHPQSKIHSMVEFVDSSVKAHISQPDMRLAIQYALFYPDRVANDNIPRFDPISTGALTFEKMNTDLYPCFELALNTVKRGGTWPAALCGADEMAVEMFLSGRIRFTEIALVIQEVLVGHKPRMTPTADELMHAAAWARERVVELVEAQ